MNFKSIEFDLPDAKENTNGFKAKIKENRKNNFFVFGKTTKQSGFREKASPKTKRKTDQSMSPKSMEFKGNTFQQARPNSSYILKKKVWIDNRQKKKIQSNKLVDFK